MISGLNVTARFWNHRRQANADGWADDVRLSDIERRFTCKRCGQRGAEVRPK